MNIVVRDRIESLVQWWDCSMCHRYLWRPLLWRHELRHSEAEWTAAGYDKAGTLAGFALNKEAK